MSEENLVAIGKRGGQYLVGTTRSKLKQFEEELLKDDFEKIRPKVKVKPCAKKRPRLSPGPLFDSLLPAEASRVRY